MIDTIRFSDVRWPHQMAGYWIIDPKRCDLFQIMADLFAPAIRAAAEANETRDNADFKFIVSRRIRSLLDVQALNDARKGRTVDILLPWQLGKVSGPCEIYETSFMGVQIEVEGDDAV